MIFPATERLRFEFMTEQDLDLMFELDQDPEVMRYLGGKLTTMVDVVEKLIPRMKSYANFELGWGLWKVYLIHSNEFVGWVLVRPMNFFNENRDDTNLELGWRFKRHVWGQGIATEAATAISNGLAESGRYKKLSAMAIPENAASIRVMEKIGMNFLKKGTVQDPLCQDVCVFYEKSI